MQRERLEDPQVDVFKILQIACVVGIALKQAKLPIDGEDGFDRFLDLEEIRRSRR